MSKFTARQIGGREAPYYQLCTCGHPRSMHWQDGVSIVRGRASCLVETCTCRNYEQDPSDVPPAG
jgi:hypothetical protein